MFAVDKYVYIIILLRMNMFNLVIDLDNHKRSIIAIIIIIKLDLILL